MADKIVYAGLSLGGDLLEWFKPYLIEIHKNGLNTTNLEVKYLFSLQEGFCNRIIQIFKDFKAEATVEYKLKNL